MGLPFPKLTAEEAAAHVRHGQTVAFSGFTPAGSPKAIPSAIAAKAEAAHQRGEPFKIGVLTGASTGPSLDGALAKADAISFRTPYQIQRGSSRTHQRRRHPLLRYASFDVATGRSLWVSGAHRLGNP